MVDKASPSRSHARNEKAAALRAAERFVPRQSYDGLTEGRTENHKYSIERYIIMVHVSTGQ